MGGGVPLVGKFLREWVVRLIIEELVYRVMNFPLKNNLIKIKNCENNDDCKMNYFELIESRAVA